MKRFGDTRIFIVLAVLPAIILFAVFYLLPMGALIVTSLFRWDSIRIGEFIGFENYIRMFNDKVFYIALRNNLSWSLTCAFVHIPLALVVALLLSRKPRGWKFLRTVYFLPHVISVTAYAVIWTSVFNPSFGLLNQILTSFGLNHLCKNWLYDLNWAWPCIIFTWVFHVGLFATILLAEILSHPNEMYEAAQVDGASRFQQEVYITIPLLRDMVGTCIVLDIAGGLRYFEGLYIMTNGAPDYHTETLALYLYQQMQLIHNSYANTLGVALLGFGALLILIVLKVFKVGKSTY
jgi:raffinose/stachyose/melibiose transport system permease protein